MTVSGGGLDGAHTDTLVTNIFKSVLSQVGLGGDAAERLIGQVLAARGAAPAGACTLRFAAHAGELEIAMSQAGRDWRASYPVPIR